MPTGFVTIGKYNKDIAQVQDEVTKLKKEISKKNSEINELQLEIGQGNQKISDLVEENVEQEKSVKKLDIIQRIMEL